MNIKTKVMVGLFCICVSLFLVLLSYNLVVSVIYLLPEQERWMNYFRGDVELNKEIEEKYTALEQSHMSDVKRVMEKVERAFWGVMGVELLLAGYLYRRKELGRALWYGGMMTIGGGVVILGWVLIDFNSLFTVFHLLLFPQGNWQFSFDSLLIRTFPIEFFISISKKIFWLTVVLAGGVMVGGYWLRKRERGCGVKNRSIFIG